MIWRPYFEKHGFVLPLYLAQNDQCLVWIIHSKIFSTLDNFYLPLTQFYNVVHKMIFMVSPNSLLILFINCRSSKKSHVTVILTHSLIVLRFIQMIKDIFI